MSAPESFVPSHKSGTLKWDHILGLRLDETDSERLGLALESLASSITHASLAPSDPQATPENLVHLFRVTQLLAEYTESKLRSAGASLFQAKAQVQDQEIEIRHLRSQPAKSTDPSFIEIRNLKDELIQLEQRHVAAKRNAERAEEALDSERAVVNQLTQSLKDEKARMVVLQDANRRLEDEIRDVRNDLSDQRTRMQSRNLDQDQFKLQLTEKNAQINRCIAEIQMLSSENKTMAAEIESLTVELEAAVSELERNSKELQETRDLLDGNDRAIESLTDERDALQIKVEDLVEQLEFQNRSQSSVADGLRDETQCLRSRIAELESVVREKDELLWRIREDLAACKRQLLDSTAEELKQELARKEATIQSLKDSLEQTNRDFELLSLDWDRLDRAVNRKPSERRLESPEAIAKNARESLESTKRLKEQLAIAQERSRKTEERAKLLEDQLAEKEHHVIDLQARISSLESLPHGTKSAVREIKNLRLQLTLKTREVDEHVQRINDLQAQNGDLAEENEELRIQLGLGQDTPIDLTNIRNTRAVELERSKSLNIRLHDEIEKLEEERLELKAALRFHAIERGERAISLGLTVEDLAAVEQYADKLRMGQDSLAKSQAEHTPHAQPEPVVRPILNIAQLDKLTLELERAHVDGAEAKEQFLKLQSEYKTLMDENHALQTAVMEISQTLIEATRQGGKEHALPKVDHLIRIMQAKYQNSPAGDAIAYAERSVAKVNRQLRRQLDDAQKAQERLKEVIAAKDSEIVAAAVEMQTLREKAKKRRDRFEDLPSELKLASSSGFASLVEQLIMCLVELGEKDDELKKMAVTLSKCEDAYEALCTKVQMLYRDHQICKQDHEDKMQKLAQSLGEANQRADLAQHKARELESLVAHLENMAGDDARRFGVEAGRKLVVLQVNEKTLSRRYTALAEVEQLLRKENARLRDDITGIDRSARETILRLHRRKREDEARIESLESMLADSVPASQHALLSNRLEAQTAKTRLLLDRERDWIEHRADQESARNDVVRLKQNVESLTLQLEEARAKLRVFEGAASEGDKQSDRHTIASLQAQVQVLETRSKLADAKVKTLESLEAEMRRRLDGADKSYLEAKDETIRVQDELLELQNRYAGGATGEENARTLESMRALQTELSEMRAEVQKYKDLADLAVTQVSDLDSLRKSDEKEKAILRAAVQELQMEDDDKLIIGKLHHHILALQMSEAVALRKLEALGAKCLRLETSLLQMEQARDERDRLMFNLRMDTKARVRLVHKNMSELRLKLAGMVLISKHERACGMLRTLDDRKRALESDLVQLQAEKQQIEFKLDGALVRLGEQEELISALRDTTGAQRRVAVWHNKMLAAQIELLKVKKECGQLQITADVAMRDRNAAQARVTELEECIVLMQNDHEEHQLEWEMRQGELEATIEKYEEERDQIFQSSSGSELKGMLPDRTLPIGQQLETALRLLVERSQAVKAQTIKLAQIETENASLKQQIQTLSGQILKKDSDLIGMQLTMAKTDAESHAKKTETALAIDMTVFEIARERESDAIKVAKSMIESLQRQITQKEALVQKYRDMIKSVRAEVAEQNKAHRAELEKSAAVIDELRSQQISRAVKVPDLAPPTGQREIEREQDAMQEMEKLLRAKEQALSELQRRMAAIEEDAAKEKKALEAEIARLHEAVSEKDEALASKQSELDGVMAEIESLREIASHPQPKDLSDTVRRLEADVEERETKISTLNKAITKLKAQIMQSAKDLAEAKIRQSNDNLSFQDQLESKTSELTSKIMQLEAKIKRMAAVIDSHKKEESELAVDLKRVSDELARKEKEMLEKSSENARLHKMVNEADAAAAAASAAAAVTASPADGNATTLHSSGAATDAAAPSGKPQATELGNEPALPRKLAQGSVHDTGGTGGLIGASEAAQASYKWELEKKYIRRVESLKKKLSEKTAACEQLQTSVDAIKQSLSRSEDERLRLQSKLSTVTQKMQTMRQRLLKDGWNIDSEPSRDNAQTKPSSDAAETTAKLRQLETLVESQMRDHLTLTQDTMEKAARINQLEAKVATLEELNEQLRRSGAAFGEVAEPQQQQADSRSGVPAGIVITLEERVRSLMDKLSQTENGKIKAETALVASRFESERSAALAHKLQVRVAELERQLDSSMQGVGPLQASPEMLKTLAAKPAAELVAVIEHLTSTAEKLRADNEHMRKNSVIASKHNEVVAELKRARKELSEMEEKYKDADAAGEKISRIESENARTRKALRREVERNKTNLAKIEELNVSKQQLMKEVISLRKALGGIDVPLDIEKELIELKERVVSMQRQLDEKEAAIQKLLQPDASEQSRLASENRRLSRELEMWMARANKLSLAVAQQDLARGKSDGPSGDLKAALERIARLESENKELRDTLEEHAADPAVAEELEDLKYNFRECMRLNVMYEEQLKQLRGQ